MFSDNLWLVINRVTNPFQRCQLNNDKNAGFMELNGI